VIKKALSILLLIATGLGLYNVYADAGGALKLAEGTACGAAGCVKLLRAERTPIGQSFTFQTSLRPPQTKAVSCERAYLLVGSFSCSVAGQ
jgi:hypothetical protein